MVGRRGSRSKSQPARPLSAVAVARSPSPAVAVALPAPRTEPARDWIGLAVGLAAGLLLGRLVLGMLQHGQAWGVEQIVFGVAAAVAAAWLLRRRQARARPAAPPDTTPVTWTEPAPVRLTDLERGIQDICRTDRGFDAARFAGYAGMTFRDVQQARMARDAGGLRDRLTPAMYVELQARCERLRSSARSARVAAVEVGAEVTEAWQDGTRDYVTAYVAGSMLSHTVDDATGRAVDGSPARPVAVEAFLTFTRPAGLNFWMLSLIQGEAGLNG